MIDFDCPECGAPIKVKSRMAGELVECPDCKGESEVPGETPAEARSKMKDKPAKGEDAVAVTFAVGMFAAGALVLLLIGYLIYSATSRTPGDRYKAGDVCTVGIRDGKVGPVCSSEEVVDSIFEAHKRKEAREIAVGHRDRGNAALVDSTDRVRITGRWLEHVRVEVLDGTHRGAFGFVHGSWLLP